MKYYLGIDGGGTRTTAAVSDEQGNILLKKAGKTINFYSVGMEACRNNLSDIIAGIYSELGQIEFAAAFIGCSALDDEADAELISRLCGGIIKAEKIGMNSDVYIALKSVGDAFCPCAAICGTGSMVIAQDETGGTQVTGGWGHIIGDEGSGYQIAISALKACCELCDKDEKSPLLDKAAEYFGVEEFRKAIDKIYSPETTKDVIAGFASDVAVLADEGNSYAVEIVKTQAQAFARTIMILLDRIKSCSVLGLYGGVFQHNASFTKEVGRVIGEKYPGVEIRLLDIPPEESALELARKMN